MRPAFSNALYYPTIDIENTDWLKTAILFWDSISTIVPESISQPYKQHDTQYLQSIDFLRPLYVNSKDKSVIGIEDDILELLHSSELSHILSKPKNGKSVGIWNDKMSKTIKNYCNLGIYNDKMSYKILEEIKYLNKHLDDQKIKYFNSEFAYIYMITLANKLCEDNSLGMITNDIPCFDIGNIVRFGNQTTLQTEYDFHIGHTKNHQLEQGLLLNLIISGLSISPDTDIDEIISFKKYHKDELGRFKTQLVKLTQNINTNIPINIIQQEIRDLYDNEFLPAFNDFKAALTGYKIKWFTETFLKTSFFYSSATSVPVALLGMPIEQAIFAGMGISVITSAISYNIDKKKFLRENPYSYLLSINRKWS